jgi:hypothetical protein
LPEQTIKCPKCGHDIPLTEAFTHQIEERLRQQFESASKRKENEYTAALKAKEQELEAALKAEKNRLAEQAKKQAEDSVAVQLRDLQQQVTEKSQKLVDAQNQELELRKKQRALEEREKALELETARKLDEERKKIWDQANAKAAEENLLKFREKELQLEQMRKQIAELKQKAEQGPQERQGEVQELELEDLLRAQFPLDVIEPVKKGERGADILQKVQNRLGHACGGILWESKRAKNWSDGWVGKLKDDQRNARADVAVIATSAMPDGISHFGQKDGVWVVEFPLAVLLGVALRETLIQVAGARESLAGMNEKKDILYNYLSSPQFRQRIDAIIEAFTTMKVDLDAEKRAMERQWSKREKQIERVVTNTAGMYGDLQGIIGNALPAVKTLELPGEGNEN